MNTSDIRARLLAFLLGVALVPFVVFVPSQWFGYNSLLRFLFDIATYSVAGFVLGFIWPNSGWRLGLYLFAVVPPLLLFEVFLAWEQPANVRAMSMNLLGYLLTLVGACVGAGLGSLIGRRASNRTCADGIE